MITPRVTRLVRARSLRSFQQAIAASCGDSAARAERCLVLVPTRAAARQLRLTWTQAADERHAAAGSPDVVTRGEAYEHLARGARLQDRWLTPYARSTLVERGAHEAITEGFSPPFNLRPALIGEILELYDELRRHRQDVDQFERLLVEELEPAAASDRGAERMLRQTRFLAWTFRAYRRQVGERQALDEHELREQLLSADATAPWGTLVVTVADRAADRTGLWPADFDLVTRLGGIGHIDVIATDAQLDAGFHARVHDLLPGIEEVRFGGDPAHSPPVLEVPSAERSYFVSRDREEELRAAVRLLRGGSHPPDATAIVFARRLPYLYLAREVFAAADMPFQCDDALPLAAEPVAAAVDLVLSFAASDAGRRATVDLLRSPHFAFAEQSPDDWLTSVSALDAALGEAGFVHGLDRLAILADQWEGMPSRGTVRPNAPRQRAAAAARAALRIASRLEPLFGRAPARAQLAVLKTFLDAHWTASSDERDIRPRRTIGTMLDGLLAAHEHGPDPMWDADALAAVVHRWIEEHVFEPRTGDEGVQLVDATTARYGAFERVHLVGLVEGEWPERRRRNIFYSSFLLRRLGWVSDADPAAPSRAAFDDLLWLAKGATSVSTIQLEDDALIEPSSLLDELESTGLGRRVVVSSGGGIFTDDALMARESPEGTFCEPAASWVELRRRRTDPAQPRYHGTALPHRPAEHGVSSVELYAQCPFKYFARHVLGVREELDEEDGLTPRDRGVFVHEVLHAFFADWQASGRGAITPASIEDARARLEAVAEPLLARLSPADAAIERVRLLGSAAAPGIGELVLRMEAERPLAVVERRLEERFSGRFELQDVSGPRAVPIRGIADRIDVLADRSLRVIDYKASVPLTPLQVAIYAACAVQRLETERQGRWTVSEAAYVVYGGRRGVRSLARRGQPLDRSLLERQQAFLDAVAAIEAGSFPARPVHQRMCTTCAYVSVCRKDYAVEPDEPDAVAAV